MRVQGGKAALVIDPEPGDIGLAVFTKSDSSGVEQANTTQVQPGSFRTFDQANGFYVSAFLNKEPEIWLELKKTGEVHIHGKTKIFIDTETDIELKASQVTITGPLKVTGAVNTLAGITNTGSTVSSNGIVLDTHTHPGDSGGVTGGPN
jgi:phage baseplate assembly protein gpV